MTTVKLEWQLGWEEWKSPLLEPFLGDSEKDSFPTVVKLRKRRCNNNRKRKRQLTERVESPSLNQDSVLVKEKLAKLFEDEEAKESVASFQQHIVDNEPKDCMTTEPMVVQPSHSEERQANKSLSNDTTENRVDEETLGSNSLTASNQVATLPSLSTGSHRHTLWQRLYSTLEKRCKQFAIEGFSPAGFVVDALPDLKVSLSIELYDQGYTKDSRKLLFPYDHHSKRLIQALDLGLIPPYEDLPTNHSFHYYQGCLIAEIRDFRSNFQGFLQTSMKSSNKSSPVTYKLILRPDFYNILSDIDRATVRSKYDGRIEIETKMQLERFLLSILFRNIHCDSHVPRFSFIHPLDSLQWNRIRRPRMNTKDDKGVLHSWRELGRGAGYLSPQSIVLYVCMIMESFHGRDEKPLEGISKTLGKSSTVVDGRKVNSNIHHGSLIGNHSVLPSSLHELSWKPIHLCSNSNLEEHRFALYTYKRNIYLSKDISLNDNVRLSGASPTRLRPDILRILAFSYARKSTSSVPTKQVHCSLQIVKKDVNSFTTNSLEHAMDFADNFRRICEFEGYVCILDSFRGPFEKLRDTSSESIPERTFQKRPSNIPNNPSVHPSSSPSTNPRLDALTSLPFATSPSISLAQAQPGIRPIPYHSLGGNPATAYGKNFPVGNHSTVPQNNASFYQGVQSEYRKRPSTGTLYSNNPIHPSSSSTTTTSAPLPTTAPVVRGPKPLVAQTSANRTTFQNALSVTGNDNMTHATFLGNKRTSSPVHSSTSSFHGANMP
ncbi:hypothetical protein Gasu2_31430 [Galdieria sulphuraria]|nr:hypothetical protein Gasu2_31430 [Galdieria sulphuraria]